LTTKSIKLAKQVHFLLLGFGIKCKICNNWNKKYGKYYHTVMLNREAAEMFYYNINFISSIKKDKLKNVVTKKHSNAFKLDKWTDSIISIEYNKKDVYDVEVCDNHSYISNGFDNHNSNIKQLEIVACGAVGVYSDITPYKNCSLRAKNEESMISHIEKLAGDIDYRSKIYNKDYNTSIGQLWWEENDNLKKYVDSYLKLFGNRLP